ncbi:MAG: hypothetical protein WCI75_15170 [candidate division NC10 bacterium]
MTRVTLFLLVFLGLVLRLGWFLTPAGALDADEAVFGLMALHILQGRDYPLFCWGAHYAGAVVSYIAAAGFHLFGTNGLVLKCATLPFVAGYLAATYGLARTCLDSRGAGLALLFAAVPPAIPLAFSVKATGGYPETLCLGGLALLLTFRFPRNPPVSYPVRTHLFLLGLTSGFGLYILPLILPYLGIAVVFLALHRWPLFRSHGPWLLTGGFLGVSPLIVHNLLYPFASVLRLGSRVLEVSRQEASQASWEVAAPFTWLMDHAARLPGRLPTLLGNVGPLLGLTTSVGALAGVAILAIAGAALWRARGIPGQDGRDVPCGIWLACLMPAILLFAWLTGLNRPRHLVSLYSVVPIGLSAVCTQIRMASPRLARFVLAAVLLGAGANIIAAATIHSTASVEELHHTFRTRGTRAVYTDYWIAYPLMFASREAVLAAPIAWADGPISDRTPAITRQVDRLASPAYAFLRMRPEAEWFAHGLQRRNVAFRREAIAEFDVFTELSAPVRSASLPVTRGW